MELEGRIVEILPEQTGQGRNGQWKKSRFLVETPGQYPKKVLVQVWGDKINNMTVEQGLDVVVSINVESREYNGNWYTDVSAWKVVAKNSGNNTPPPNMGPPPPPQSQPIDTSQVPPGSEPDRIDDMVDDLPF